LDALRDAFTVKILAGHDNNSAIAPVISGWKNPAMPEREDRAMAGFEDLREIFRADGFPPDGMTDGFNDQVSCESDNPGFQTFLASKRSNVRIGLHFSAVNLSY